MNLTTLHRCTIGLFVASALLALYVAHQAIAVAVQPAHVTTNAPR